jgi:hypothetical protein
MISRDRVRWCTSPKITTDASHISKAHQMQRSDILRHLVSFQQGVNGPVLEIYGEFLWRSVLSDFLMVNNYELQEALDDVDGSGVQDLLMCPNTFLPPKTEIDFHILHIDPLHLTSYVDEIVTFLQHEMNTHLVVLSSFHVACQRLTVEVQTVPHIMAPVISTILNFTVGYQLPDFTNTQLTLDVQTGAIGVVGSQTRHDGWPRWWSDMLDLHKSMQLPVPHHRPCTYGVKSDWAAQAIRFIQGQATDMQTFVLVYSFNNWSSVQHNLKRIATVSAYQSYVFKIVGLGVQKMVQDGFTVNGLQPEIRDFGLACFFCHLVTPFEQISVGVVDFVGNSLHSDETVSKVYPQRICRTTMKCRECHYDHDLVHHLL